MKETIDCKVVMLPTAGLVRLFQYNGVLGWHKECTHNHDTESGRHLYFTSNEKPREGEYYIHSTHGSTWVLKATATDVQLWMNGHDFGIKVAASTDPSLGLPAIPESFLKLYAESNGKITDVKLGMEEIRGEKEIETCPVGETYVELDVTPGFYTLKLTANNEVVVDTRVNCVKPTTILGGSPQVAVQTSSGIHPIHQSEYKRVSNTELEDAARQYTSGHGYSRDTYLAFKAGWEANPKQWTDEDMIKFAKKVSWRPEPILQQHLEEYKNW